jgi:hypothetical protein
MLYVADSYTDQIGRLGIRRRLMMLQQAYLDLDEHTIIADDAERDDPVRALSLINGQLMPEIHMLRGEPQVWSLVNGSTSAKVGPGDTDARLWHASRGRRARDRHKRPLRALLRFI